MFRPFLKKSPFSTGLNLIKYKIFHKSELSRIKKVLIYIILIFVCINTLVAISYYFDLRHFALNFKGFTKPILVESREGLSTPLLSIYNSSSTPKTPLGFTIILSLVASFVLLELTVIWTLLRSWIWQLRKVLGRVIFSFAMQLLLLMPVLTIVFVPEKVITDLSALAQTEVEKGILEIQQSQNSPGAIYSIPEIVSQLQTTSTTPIIVSGDFFTSTLDYYYKHKSTDTFYSIHLIPSVIIATPPRDLMHHAILLHNQFLILDPKLSRKDTQSILSALTMRTLSDSIHSDRLIAKPPPVISFLENDAYVMIENRRLAEQEQKILNFIASLVLDSNNNHVYIKETSVYLSSLQAEKANYEAEVKPLLTDCRGEYSETDCQNAEQIIGTNLANYDTAISTTNANLQSAQSYIALYDRALENARSALSQFRAFPVIPELQAGVFDPPSDIMVKYTGIEHESTDYYYTLLHEIFHYLSYRPFTSFPSFLEEGLTDYLSTSLGAKTVSAETDNVGYPDEMKIIKQLITLLTEEKLTNIYFSKSVKDLANALEPHCGKTCYLELSKIGEKITYTTLEDRELRDNLVSEALTLLTSQ